MKKRKLNPLITVLLCAFGAMLLTVLILHFFVGYRYINDKENGIKFIGITKSGVAYDGKLYYSNGTKGKLDGKNSLITINNGDQYEGELLGHLPNGKGVFRLSDGTVYEGTFINGEFTGNAKVKYSWKDRYEGQMLNGKRNGFGTYSSQNGAEYTGNFTDGNKDKYGKSTFENGSVYIGEYKNSVKEGFGAYLFDSGDIYVGEFSEDKRTGRGIYIWAKSEEYASEFDELFLNVEFTEQFANEFFDYFKSDFNNHFSDSEAEITNTLEFWQTFESILSRSQIECYIGEFSENKLHGTGEYTWLSGRKYQGSFTNGEILIEETPSNDD